MSKIWLNFIYKKKINAAWNWLVCKPQTCYKMVSSVSFFCSEYSSMQYLIVNYFHSFAVYTIIVECTSVFIFDIYNSMSLFHMYNRVSLRLHVWGFDFFFFLQLVPKYNILLMHKIHWYSVNTIPVHVPSLFYLQCENFFLKQALFFLKYSIFIKKLHIWSVFNILSLLMSEIIVLF